MTLQYAGLTAAVFFVFVMAVYYVSEHSRSNAFFRNLQSEAITKAHLFLTLFLKFHNLNDIKPLYNADIG